MCLILLERFEHLYYIILQQKGTFETGQEDSAEVPEELKLRLAYREAAVAVLACYFPDPHRPFTEVVKHLIFYALYCVYIFINCTVSWYIIFVIYMDMFFVSCRQILIPSEVSQICGIRRCQAGFSKGKKIMLTL